MTEKEVKKLEAEAEDWERRGRPERAAWCRRKAEELK